MKVVRDRTANGVFMLLVKIWLVAMAFVGVFVSGQYVNQQGIRQRALKVDTHCYTEQQLEYIIFGVIQE